MNELAIAIIGSGLAGSVATFFFSRKKLAAEAQKLRAERSKVRAEKDVLLVGEYRKLIDDSKAYWELQMKTLQEEVSLLKEKEVEILRQNTLILEHNRDLSKRLGELEKENKKLVVVLDNTTKKLRRYEAALKKQKIPKPK